MNRCTECAREIEGTATVCEACAAWVASVLPAATHDAAETPAPQLATAAPVAPAKRPAGRRELLFAVMGIAGAALVTSALLMMRGGAAANVSAATGIPAARPAARPPAPPASSAPLIIQKWSTANRAYWIGNQKHAAAFELQADFLVQTWFGPVRPSLIVRCTSRTMQTFVYTGSPMRIEPHADGKTVRISLDDQPMATERWPDSDDHDALFAPDGAAFAERLLHGQTLRFGYSPHNANDVVAQFHVSGLAELIDPVKKDCGLTK